MTQSYSEKFFKGLQGSGNSAEVIVPLTLSLFPSHSVVDIGCGVGAWLSQFARCGVTDYLGVDGHYVPRHLLEIPPDRFIPHDLTKRIEFCRRFDLACSLEVAEHLPAECAEQFVSVLVKAAPVVLFSAAIPGQGGINHVNEQWQSYWAELFANHRYVGIDCIRPKIFYNDQVEWWYRQNIVVFCEPERCPPKHAPVKEKYYLDRIHPQLFSESMEGPKSGRESIRAAIGNLKLAGRAMIRITVQNLQKIGYTG